MINKNKILTIFINITGWRTTPNIKTINSNGVEVFIDGNVLLLFKNHELHVELKI